MQLGWGALVLLVIAGAAIWFLQDSLAARERANEAALEACRRLSLKLLDGTVAFARLSFVREQGQLTIRRTYVFDYTANSIERRQGFVILLGRRVESVGYAPGEERRSQPQAPSVSLSATFAPPPSAEPPAGPESPNVPAESAQVFDLADWRARRRGADQQQPPSQRRTGATDHGNGQDHHH
jgi:Protein of unknown function (DUF3301).|nr:DUF3301 domain-containing protein [uncultured Steroidobacter sp.]